MFEFEEYRQKLENNVQALSTLKEALHISRTLDEIAELEARAQEPGFWDDVERAQKIQTKVKHLQNKVDRFARLERENEDLQVILSLGLR
jgi:peptide chain release factor 2